MKTITVYCGAAEGSAKYVSQMDKLVEWFIGEGYHVVYGGGKVGLMGHLADSVLEKGGEVTGVMPHLLKEREIAHPHLTKMILTENMSERKRKMIELGDVFLAFPGGPGTLEEITEVISWARIGEHLKPCIVYNYNGYYDALCDMYDKMVEEGFLDSGAREKILFSDKFEEISGFVSAYVPPKIRQYED